MLYWKKSFEGVAADSVFKSLGENCIWKLQSISQCQGSCAYVWLWGTVTMCGFGSMAKGRRTLTLWGWTAIGQILLKITTYTDKKMAYQIKIILEKKTSIQYKLQINNCFG